MEKQKFIYIKRNSPTSASQKGTYLYFTSIVFYVDMPHSGSTVRARMIKCLKFKVRQIQEYCTII